MTAGQSHNGPNRPFMDGSLKNNIPTSLELGGLNWDPEQPKTKGFSVTCILFTGVVAVEAIFIFIACLVSASHRVETDSIALYFRNGALLNTVSSSGLHMMPPFITTMAQVTTRPETYFMKPLTCTTADGVGVVFRDVQVISSLKEDKVFQLVLKFGNDVKKILLHDRINEGISMFCANNSIDEVYNTKFIFLQDFVKERLNFSINVMANHSLVVWNLFIPKPEIPPAIAQNYREVKIE